jgi:glycosyltransferase involved in cell wall biosynthesis
VYVPIKRGTLEKFINGLFFMAGGLFKALKLGRFDIYAPQHFFPVAPIWVGSKLLDTPIVVTIHDVFYTPEWIQQYGLKGFLMSIFEKISLKISYTKMITVSNSSKEKLVAGGVSRKMIEVIPNGVDLALFDKVRAQKADRPRVIYVGRLIEYKHVDELLMAFSKLNLDAELYIMGVGPERKKLEELARRLGIGDRTTFTGFLGDVQKIELLKSSHVCVLPSTVEGFGIAVVEAMAAGVPTLSADIPALREVTRGGEVGLLFTPRNVDELAMKLNGLLKNEKLQRELAEKGYKHVKAKFAWDTIAEKVERVFAAQLFK